MQFNAGVRSLSLLSAGFLLATTVWNAGGAQDEGRSPGAQRQAQLLCAGSVVDQATGSCIGASSVPAPGKLLPLGPELHVEPSGEVGIGTSEPLARLDVNGSIRSRSGGIEFPDGTVQTSAAAPIAFDPTAAVGTVTFALGGCPGPAPVYEVTHRIERNGGLPMATLSFEKDVDVCSVEIATRAVLGQVLGQVVLELGDLRIVAEQCTVKGVRATSGPRALPRETVELAFTELEWVHLPSGDGGTWSFSTQTGSSSPSLGSATLSFLRPDQDPVPGGSYECSGADQTIGGGPPLAFQPLLLRRSVDELTPVLYANAAAGIFLDQVDASLMVAPSGGGKDELYLTYRLENVAIRSVELSVDVRGELQETLELAGLPTQWRYEIGGNVTTTP